MDYVEVRCEPTIGFFSVRPVGTAAYNAGALPGLTPMNSGWTYDRENSGYQSDDSSNVFAACDLGYTFDERHAYRLNFEVIRTKVFLPTNCRECGLWSGLLEVRLNGEKISEGRVGRHDVRPLANISYEGDELHVCASRVSASYREADKNGGYDLRCKSGRVSLFLEKPLSRQECFELGAGAERLCRLNYKDDGE